MSAATKRNEPLYKVGELLYKQLKGKFIPFKVRDIAFNDCFQEYYYSTDDFVGGAYESSICGLVPKVPYNPNAPKSGRLMR